ncbi:MAG TPA: DNA methyltransferase [Pirellulales bacterium]|nr:DNA methyltransferase [Pirellulales bacterium]
MSNQNGQSLACGFESAPVGKSLIVYADCLEWLAGVPENTIHAIVTDPPYGVKEYEADQLAKREVGRGGIWRIPPSFDGHVRAPLPRFTALDRSERQALRTFFAEWSRSTLHALRPGGHVFIATNAFIAQLLYDALVEGGLEFRGQVIRLVRTLRGGDRPKNAEAEFPGVSSMPKGCYEPWGIFRKPMPDKITVAECLRRFQTGALRRTPDDRPFEDCIRSERTSRAERAIANHPSLKPQSFLRQVVYASLPLGEGIVVDPFMGSGSTVAAAEALGLSSIGIERHREYFDLAAKAIPQLARIASAIPTPREQPSLF